MDHSSQPMETGSKRRLDALSLRKKLIRWPVPEPQHLSALSEVLHSSNWHYGNRHTELESQLRDYFSRPVVTTASCAWALYLALRALDTDGLVAVPAFGYHGTVHPIVWASCTPLFVDCDPTTYNIDPHHLESLLVEYKVSAVIAVHMHGLPVDQSIFDLCAQHGIPVIEDACQAFGSKVGGAPVGALGMCAALSFNSRKSLPAGLGGALLTSSDALAARVSELIAYGCSDVSGYPAECGYYLPMGEFDAALVLAQLPRIEDWVARASTYVERLRTTIGDRCPKCPAANTHTWHKVRIRASEAERQAIERAGVPTSRWGERPLWSLSAYTEHGIRHGNFTGTIDICENTFCLMNDEYPLHAQDEHVVEEIVGALERIIR